MKQLFAIILACFALTAFAADQHTADVEKASTMKLAKKKDHSKDKKVDATKSPKSDKKAASKKTK